MLAALACLACENTALNDNDANGDGDSDQPFGDGDASENDHLEISGEGGWACKPQACRDGFLDPPRCVLPDEDRLLNQPVPATCTTPEECETGETCVQATPDWICVPEDLPQWVAGYRWMPHCAWLKIGERLTDCAVLGGWDEGGELATLEQCRDSERGRICIGERCIPTDKLENITLVDIAQCAADGKTYLLLRQDSMWPVGFYAYAIDEDGLHAAGAIREESYYYSDAVRSHFACGRDGSLLWIAPGTIARLQGDEFKTWLTLAEIQQASPDLYIYGAFDGVRFDTDGWLQIGIMGSNQGWAVRRQMENGETRVKAFSLGNWLTRAWPAEDNLWVMLGGAQVYSASMDDADAQPAALFDLGDNQTASGLEPRGGLMTLTLTRIFRYPLGVLAESTALDAGLPFPADYPGYVPAVRQFLFLTGKDVNEGFVLLQYRATAAGNGGGGPDPGWED
ncbi:MAG: hypothetical protein C4523_04080 [Myxococcales bacterium]|nr:MAG: hypothetical protein C4523_04080 [Myxococcales bacterium]